MGSAMHRLLSDRHRGAKAALSIAAAAAAVAWGVLRGPEATRHFSHVLRHPAAYRGEEVVAVCRRVLRGADGEVRIGPFLLVGPDAARIPQGTSIVSFRGRLDEEDRIHVAVLHVHRFEGIRLGVSGAALAAVVALLAIERRGR